MSHVTNVILLGDVLGSTSKKLPRINDWLDEHAAGQRFANINGDTAKIVGGNKEFEAECYIAAFNYLDDMDGLIYLLRGIEWDDDAQVQVCYMDHHQDSFTLLTIKGE